jgi:azurin
MVALFEPGNAPYQATYLMHKELFTRKRLRTLLIGLMLSLPTVATFAQVCETTIQSDDALRFTPEKIEIPLACKTFTVTLKHTGRLPKLAMGHNWVLAKLNDLDGVSRTGMLAGAEYGYVDPKDVRVIAHTGVVGGGESTSVSFDVSKLSADHRYGFVCTFAGHSPIMRGIVVLN